MGEKSVLRLSECLIVVINITGCISKAASVDRKPFAGGTREAGLTRQVQNRSPFYSQSSRAGKNTQRSARSGGEQGKPFSPLPPCPLREEGPDKEVGMLGQEVDSTNPRDGGSCQTWRHVPGTQRGLPHVEGAYMGGESIARALEPQGSEFGSQLFHLYSFVWSFVQNVGLCKPQFSHL